MKVADLLENTYRHRSKEQIAAEKASPDYWRKQLRAELAKLYRLFDARLDNAARFSPMWMERDKATFGGTYVFWDKADADALTFSKEDRFELWKKAYAQKIKQLLDEGYRIQLCSNAAAAALHHTNTVAQIHAIMQKQMQPRNAHGSISVEYYMYVTEPHNLPKDGVSSAPQP